MLLQNAMYDLRYALRQLRKNPGFTALAVGTLALGITANLTIFSWINSTLLNPIPGIAHTSDMIAIMRGERSEHPTPPFSYLDFADLRDSTHAFSGLIGYHDDYMSITGSGQPERIYGTLASSNYFEVLGVRPILGRSLLPSLSTERTGSPEAVLGYDLWQNRFSGDPSIVGKTIQINLHPYTVVGVAPKGFQGCKTGLRSDIWIPLGMDKQVWGSTRIENRDGLWLNVLGRLAPGVDRAQAESELNVLMQRIVGRFPDRHLGPNKITSDPLWRSPFGANVYLYGTLPMLLALAGALLLLACANVANLLLVRSVGRRREMAIRLSMGASHWRVVRQLLVENLLIALAGGGVALMLTLWTATTMSVFLPPTTIKMGSVFERIAAAFAGSFGLLALVLAAVGIYGVVAYTTRQRTHEIGIRMALGAGQGDVFRSVLQQGIRLALFGLAAGLAVSFAFTRFLRGMLFGVGEVDWITFASVAAVLFLVAVTACFVPARRAASIEPMQALRNE
jgi:predicted permease